MADIESGSNIVDLQHVFCTFKDWLLGYPVLGDHNTGILVLCTILVYKTIPVLYSSIVPVLLN